MIWMAGRISSPARVNLGSTPPFKRSAVSWRAAPSLNSRLLCFNLCSLTDPVPARMGLHFFMKNILCPKTARQFRKRSYYRIKESAKEDNVILVLFEVTIKKEGRDDYLKLAAGLKAELERAEGYIRSERFISPVNEGRLLSLSLWENEQAVEKWRNSLNHRRSQRQGHDSLFQGYTITVASKIRSYTDNDRGETPEDSINFFADAPDTGGPTR